MTRDVLRILQEQRHSVNRALKIPCSETRAVPAIVGEDGCPVCAILFAGVSDETIQTVRKFIPVRILPPCYSTDYNVEQVPTLAQVFVGNRQKQLTAGELIRSVVSQFGKHCAAGARMACPTFGVTTVDPTN